MLVLRLLALAVGAAGALVMPVGAPAAGPLHAAAHRASAAALPARLARRTPRCAVPRCVAAAGGEDIVVEEDAFEDDASGAEPDETKDDSFGLADGESRASVEEGEQVLRVRVAGKTISFRSGVMARLASGAVTAVVGDTHVFSTACLEKQVGATRYLPNRANGAYARGTRGRHRRRRSTSPRSASTTLSAPPPSAARR